MITLGGDMGRVAEEKRLAGCAGKFKFRSFAKAAAAAKRFKIAHQEREPVAAPYRCRACGFYHLGTSNQKEGRPLPRARRDEEEFA